MIEDWKFYHIEDFGAISTGTTPSTKKPEYYGGEYKFISPVDLDNGKYVSTAHKFITDAGLRVSRTLPKNAILVGCIGNIGKIGMTSDNVSAFNQQINAIVCNERFLPDFIYYLLIHNKPLLEKSAVKTTLPILNKGNFQKIKLKAAKLPEQRKIAYILSTVQKAIEQQDKLIRHTTELKKALMQKLFTVGITDYDDDTEHTDKKQKKSVKSFNPRQSVMQTRKQKQTEIGLVPESWEVVELGDVCEKPQYGFTDSASLSGNAKFLRITDITEYGVQWNDVPFCNCNDVSKYELKDGDIVFARIGATTGKSYLINNPPKSVYASYLIRVRCKKEISPDFLIYYFASEQYRKQIDSTKGNNLKGGVNGSILSKLFIPKPCIAEQNHIAKTFKTLDLKIAFNIKKKQTLTALFKTLLHELMSGQRRLHEIEFEALNKEYKLDEEPLSMVAEPLATVAKNTTDKNGSKL